jgi:hypothetical protein
MEVEITPLTPTPEWISMLAPFVSGAAGIGIAYGVMRQRLTDIGRIAMKNEQKLDKQVGEDRCYKMRAECKEEFKDHLVDIKKEVEKNRDFVSSKFEAIAKFMGKFNGK